MKDISLSICMIVKNESKYLPYAIESVKDIASEIIILDTGSSDNTKDICRDVSHTPLKLFSFSWNDNFSDARNESIKYATQDWIMILDADNVLDEKSRSVLPEYLNNKDTDLYYIKWIDSLMFFENMGNDIYENCEFDITISKTHYEDQSTVSLKPCIFRNNSEIKFEGRIFEKVVNFNENKVKVLNDICIYNYMYEVKLFEEKDALKKRLLKLELENDLPDNVRKLYLRTKLLNTEINVKNIDNTVLNDQIFAFNKELEETLKGRDIQIFHFWYCNLAEYFLLKPDYYKDALDFIIKAINNFHNSPDLLFIFYKVLFNLGRVYDCIKIIQYIKHIALNNLVLTNPEISYIHTNADTDYLNSILMYLCFEVGDYEACDFYFNQIEKSYKFIKLFNKIKDSIEKPSEILNQLEESAGNKPFATEYFRLAREYVRELQYQKAHEMYMNALKETFIENNHLLEKLIFSELILNAKQFVLDSEFIKEIIDEGQQISENFSYFWYCLGKYYLASGETGKVLQAFEKALEIEQNHIETLKKNELISDEKNRDFVDLIALNMNDEYLYSQIIDNLDLAKKVSNITISEKFNKFDEIWKQGDIKNFLQYMERYEKSEMNDYEKYIFYDYISIASERLENYKDAVVFSKKAFNFFPDKNLLIRESKEIQRKYMILYNSLNSEFKKKHIEYEWEECFKEIEKMKPSVVLEFGTNGDIFFPVSEILKDDALMISIIPTDGYIENGLESEQFKTKLNPAQNYCTVKEKSNDLISLKLKEIIGNKNVDVIIIDWNGELKEIFDTLFEFLSPEGIVVLNNIRNSMSFKDIKDILKKDYEALGLWKEFVSKKMTREIISEDIQNRGGIGIIYNKGTERKFYPEFNFVSFSIAILPDSIRMIYIDSIELMKHSFDELNIKWTYSFNKLEKNKTNIIFVTGSDPKLSNYLLDYTYIIFQMEQMGYSRYWTFMDDCYRRLLRTAAHIWDYSDSSIEYIKNELGINNISKLRIGFHEKMKIFDFNKEKTIDILFYGQLSSRRKSILDELAKKGFKVKVLLSIYEKERNDYIEKSKIILNICRLESTILEEHRISFLINNKCFVISEIPDYMENNIYGDNGIVFCKYENIVKTCEFYLRPENETLRNEIAENGYNFFSNNKMTDNLRQVLKEINF